MSRGEDRQGRSEHFRIAICDLRFGERGWSGGGTEDSRQAAAGGSWQAAAGSWQKTGGLKGLYGLIRRRQRAAGRRQLAEGGRQGDSRDSMGSRDSKDSSAEGTRKDFELRIADFELGNGDGPGTRLAGRGKGAREHLDRGRSSSDRLEGLPIDPELPNGGPQRAQFQVLSSPVRHHGGPSGGRVEPLAVRSTLSSREFLAIELLEFSGDLPIPHGRVTTPSNQMGAF